MKDGYENRNAVTADLAERIREAARKQEAEAVLAALRRQSWFAKLSTRDQQEIAFARLYAKSFGHGTDGHNRLLLIARLADMLDHPDAMPITG